MTRVGAPVFYLVLRLWRKALDNAGMKSIEKPPRTDIVDELGLRTDWRWLKDLRFGLALLAGVAFWLALIGLVSTQAVMGWSALFSLVLIQPVIEELLFRGLLQGQVLQLAWGRRQWAGVTTANLMVSVVFVALHFLTHPPLWAFGVLFPSLLFGYFRDRHHSVYPSMALHVFYNAGFFLLPLFHV